MNKHIVIFGASQLGKEALNYYGKENVLYFCDNDYKKIGTYIEGIQIICIHKLYSIKDSVEVIIASAYKDEIKEQLINRDIKNIEIYSKQTKVKIMDEQIIKKLDFNKIEEAFLRKSESSAENLSEKIKIRFLFGTSIKWKAQETLYNEFIKDSRCDTKIIVLPYYGKYNNQILEKEKIDFIRHDEYNFDNDKPDIFIYNDVDELSRPIEFNSIEVAKKAKVIYIEGILHNLLLDKKSILDQLNTEMFKKAWKVILSDRDYYQVCLNNDMSNRNNKVLLTNPRWDNIINNINKNHKYPQEWEEKLFHKKVFLWNPMYYIPERVLSTFHEWLEILINTFHDNSDNALIIRPHPSLFKSILENRIWDKEEINRFFKLIKNSKSIVLDEEIDYIKAYSISNALISDLSTMLLTYLPTRNPVLYLKNSKETQIYNKEALKVYYMAEEKSDLLKFIDMVKKGRDPLLKERTNYLKEKLGILDGKAGMKIKNYIIDEFIK
ncbi:TPR/glycosyl transferase domain-containing protein [Clostridium carnis]|uniref:TPR/glycosyl transferase domain-containing protein n=1 Tax=Clostridium carnis TaxID=1530 RepID=A0ABY6SMI2_9CLOT|nr:hypothetical protein [Clostridium carnis]VDG69323.1 TPR/glycosyl transferase domain-containing protein [Clostridium carnis]